MSRRAPAIAIRANHQPTVSLPAGLKEVRGYDFNRGVDLHALLDSFLTTGFQATSMAQAIHEIRLMIAKRRTPVEEEEVKQGEEEEESGEPCTRLGCTIFLGYTSNMISSGVRESIRYLAEHKMVDVMVTTAGGIEEDLIKCLAPTFLGDFSLCGKELREMGVNRIGNMLIPNDNYLLFERWLMPILDQMLLEQNSQGTRWTPSRMIHRFGKEINNPESVYYWAYKNNIPVFSPALTDGAIGDNLYYHSFTSPGLVLDLVDDIHRMDNLAAHSRRSGIIVLGGGLVKHHICNANLMRDGADHAVFVNTGQEFDGSDSGARPDEAKSWGKIKSDARAVKVYADATLVFPLIVAKTFALQDDLLNEDAPNENICSSGSSLKGLMSEMS